MIYSELSCWNGISFFGMKFYICLGMWYSKCSPHLCPQKLTLLPSSTLNDAFSLNSSPAFLIFSPWSALIGKRNILRSPSTFQDPVLFQDHPQPTHPMKYKLMINVFVSFWYIQNGQFEFQFSRRERSSLTQIFSFVHQNQRSAHSNSF